MAPNGNRRTQGAAAGITARCMVQLLLIKIRGNMLLERMSAIAHGTKVNKRNNAAKVMQNMVNKTGRDHKVETSCS